jgi:hypothetical protein
MRAEQIPAHEATFFTAANVIVSTGVPTTSRAQMKQHLNFGVYMKLLSLYLGKLLSCAFDGPARS